MIRTSQTLPVGGGGPAYFPPISIGGIPKRFAFLAPDDQGGGGQQQQQQQQGQGQQQQQQQQGKAITFASQDELDEFVEKRLGRTRRPLESKIEELTKKLEQLEKGGQQQGNQQQQQGNGEKVYTQAEVEALIAKEWKPQLEKANGRIEKLLDVQRENAILGAAANAYNPSQVAQLLKGEVGYDDEGNLVVVDQKGNPRLGGDGKPVTVESHVAAYLEANKHLVKGSQIGGVGSSSRNTTQGAQQGNGRPTIQTATDALTKALGG